MTQLKKIVRAIYTPLGGAAKVLGQQYLVYRMMPTSTGSILQPENIAIAKFNCYMQRSTSKQLLETQIFDLVAYAATGNALKLQVGDILVETGFAANGGRFCIAQIRYSNPFRIVAMKVETDAQIRFNKFDAGEADPAQPQSARFVEKYGGSRLDYEAHLTLTNGVYGKTAYNGAAAAVIPIGVAIKDRVRDDHDRICRRRTARRKTSCTSRRCPVISRDSSI